MSGQEELSDKIARIKRELESVPTLPGVYLWKDDQGGTLTASKTITVS